MFEHMSLLVRSPCSFKRQKMVLFWCVCLCGVFLCVLFFYLKREQAQENVSLFPILRYEWAVISEMNMKSFQKLWVSELTALDSVFLWGVINSTSFLLSRPPLYMGVYTVHLHEAYMGWWALWWTRIGGWSISSLQLRESRDWHKIAHQQGLWIQW